MFYYFLKFIISAFIIVLISEIAKRHSGFAALVAALPLTSVLAIIWLYIDGSTSKQIADFSNQIFWLVLPSLVLFLVLTQLLKQGLGFWLGLGLSVLASIISYLALLPLLRRFGVHW
jgi:ABC-type dipeptide/oligopeptide/nickel transport system permease subunit